MALLCFHRSTINSAPYKIKVIHHKNNYFSDLTFYCFWISSLLTQMTPFVTLFLQRCQWSLCFLSPIFIPCNPFVLPSLYSPSREETPTKPKSRCLQEQPPGWSTRELRCAEPRHPLESLSLSPAMQRHGQENRDVGWVRTKIVKEELFRTFYLGATYFSVRSSQDHVFRLTLQDERGLHNDFQVWERGVILCENKNSCSGRRVTANHSDGATRRQFKHVSLPQ